MFCKLNRVAIDLNLVYQKSYFENYEKGESMCKRLLGTSYKSRNKCCDARKLPLNTYYVGKKFLGKS